MKKLYTKLAVARHFARNDSGATAIEYGLIAGLVAVVIIAGVTLVGDDLDALFKAISGTLKPLVSTPTT